MLIVVRASPSYGPLPWRKDTLTLIKRNNSDVPIFGRFAEMPWRLDRLLICLRTIEYFASPAFRRKLKSSDYGGAR